MNMFTTPTFQPRRFKKLRAVNKVRYSTTKELKRLPTDFGTPPKNIQLLLKILVQ